jgi:transposase
MEIYQNIIGIDIGKFNFFVSFHQDKMVHEFENSSEGISSFLKQFKKTLSKSLVVLEATGGYEMNLLLTLCKKKISVHRANTRKVKNFIRSLGNAAKTDNLDAKALAFYGFERSDRLELFVPVSDNLFNLYALVSRRKDLKQILVAEKNRLQRPGSKIIVDSCNLMIEVLNKQIKDISEQVEKLIISDSVLKSRYKILITIPGIGKIIAAEILALMPELGSMTRRQVASLSGVAPKANDSGKFQGYRKVANGRNIIKPALFLAAMAARNSKSHLKEFYENLIARGKKKMVALTALMRKIIVIANAKIKDFNNQKIILKHS